jgi:nitrite reductase (NADH) small subunit
MANFVKVASAADVKPGTGTCVEVDGKPVALFNVDGTFYATDNTCPHRGGPLGEGELDGLVITCPWHNWQYDVRTGESLTDDLKVDTYQVKVEGGDVLVAV